MEADLSRVADAGLDYGRAERWKVNKKSFAAALVACACLCWCVRELARAWVAVAAIEAGAPVWKKGTK